MSIILLSFVLIPSVSYAEDNVFYCMENKENCSDEEGADKTEAKPPIQDKSNNEIDEKQALKVGVTAWDYIKTLFALVFVVGLLYGLLKFINRKNRLYDKNRLMKNLGGLSLGQQKSIQLIVVGDTYYLVGVGEDIRLLKEITDEKEIASLLEYYEENDVMSSKGPLEQLLSKFSSFKKQNPNNMEEQHTDFSQVLNNRLTEIKTERKRQLNRLTEKERDQDV
ncbi:hypothetical protein BI350_12430 [Sporosarcina ureilytica]|uniref:Flagellar protein n=2 Tax=Sporosarcina ureilytica TaxID=298596 RepID=A0A1D8JKL8_9BACL|nr:hypothetical protein BI350_12430 [Sporosarcina ureilytica]